MNIKLALQFRIETPLDSNASLKWTLLSLKITSLCSSRSSKCNSYLAKTGLSGEEISHLMLYTWPLCFRGTGWYFITFRENVYVRWDGLYIISVRSRGIWAAEYLGDFDRWEAVDEPTAEIHLWAGEAPLPIIHFNSLAIYSLRRNTTGKEKHGFHLFPRYMLSTLMLAASALRGLSGSQLAQLVELLECAELSKVIDFSSVSWGQRLWIRVRYK